MEVLVVLPTYNELENIDHVLRRIRAALPKSDAWLQAARDFRWMFEEFKASVFAQELGTAFPVSPKRLDEQLARIEGI